MEKSLSTRKIGTVHSETGKSFLPYQIYNSHSQFCMIKQNFHNKISFSLWITQTLKVLKKYYWTWFRIIRIFLFFLYLDHVLTKVFYDDIATRFYHFSLFCCSLWIGKIEVCLLFYVNLSLLVIIMNVLQAS